MFHDINERELISIIIPVYNAECSLDKCINSLINQTYKHIEIILIDDGSIDRSKDVCKKYSDIDRRIIFFGQKNKGAGAARNMGIDVAKGEYIAFVDADDYLNELYLEYLYYLLKKYETDISICGRNTVRCDGKLVKVDRNYGAEKLINSVEVIKDILYEKKYGSGPVCKMYKKSLWEGLYFSEVTLGEDLAVIYKVIERSKYIAIGKYPYYYVVLSKGSLLRKPFEVSKMKLLDVAKDIITYAKEHPEIYKAALSRLVASCFHLFLQIGNEIEYKDYKKQCSEIIKKNRKIVFLDGESRFKTRIACFISYFGLKKVEWIFRFYKNLLLCKNIY